MLVEENIEKEANARNLNAIFPKNLLQILFKANLNALVIGEEFGGVELDTISTMLVLEKIAYSDASLAHLLATINYGFLLPIQQYGGHAQKECYLKEVILKGEIGTLAYTESEKITSTFVKFEDEDFLLNGIKSMITCSDCSRYSLVYSQTVSGLSVFIVDLQYTDGIQFSKRDETMGLNSLRVGDIYFNNVKLNRLSLLGTLGQGLEILSKSMEGMRLSNAAISLGIARRAYDEAIRYSKTRRFYDEKLFDQQIVQYELASIRAELEMMEATVYSTAEQYDLRGANQSFYSSCCKLVISEKAKEICDKTLQIFGGSGYFKGVINERLYRDIRVMTIMGGISDMLKWSIAKYL